MKLDQFRKLVKAEFGEDLRHATPANVRDFLDGLDSEIVPRKPGERIVLDEPCSSYEEVIKDFFAQVLDLPPEEAVMALWVLSFDLAFAAIESQYAEKFASLFPDIE